MVVSFADESKSVSPANGITPGLCKARILSLGCRIALYRNEDLCCNVPPLLRAGTLFPQEQEVAMARPRLVLCSLVVFLAASTAGAVDKEKLRQALHLPEVDIMFGCGLSSAGDFVNQADAGPQPEKIAQLEKELKGDVSDAERYSSLARLYFGAGQPDKAKGARRKATELFRQRLAQHPNDPACTLDLANILEDLKEAEPLVRSVTLKHPKDWHGWVQLGAILDAKGFQEIRGNNTSPLSGTEELMRSFQAAPPSTGQLATARRYHEEALACLDRAVALAPREEEPYRRRGASRYSHGILEGCLRLCKGEKVDGGEILLNREALPDLRKAVTLAKEEYLGLGLVVMQETMMEVRDHSAVKLPIKQPKKLFDSLSEAGKKCLREDLAVLEKGMQNPDRHKAAEAGEVLGLLQYMLLGDNAAAEKTLRQCLRLDPSRKMPWEMLAGVLREQNKFQEVADLCREHLELKDSAWNRVFLAKAYEDLHQLNKAEEVVYAGLAKEPSSFLLRLALTDLLLMRGGDDSVRQASDILKRMRQEELAEAKYEKRWANYMFTCGVYLGLTGSRDQARQWLLHLQKDVPRYGKIQEALKALDD
jgi:tetratricopeptide (TPR) repeat protein